MLLNASRFIPAINDVVRGLRRTAKMRQELIIEDKEWELGRGMGPEPSQALL